MNMKKLGVVVGGIVLALVVLALGFTRMGAKSLMIDFPLGGGIAVEADKLPQSELLEKMWADDFGKAGMIDWLSRRSVFQVTDARAVEALGNLCGDFPAAPIGDRVAKQQECAEITVAKALRELARTRKPPFHYVGFQIRVGVSLDEEHRPTDGYANACQEGELLGRKVELTNPLNHKQIQVTATGRYPCSGMGITPDIQLNEADAAAIFDGALLKHQVAVAVVLD